MFCGVGCCDILFLLISLVVVFFLVLFVGEIHHHNSKYNIASRPLPRVLIGRKKSKARDSPSFFHDDDVLSM